MRWLAIVCCGFACSGCVSEDGIADTDAPGDQPGDGRADDQDAAITPSDRDSASELKLDGSVPASNDGPARGASGASESAPIDASMATIDAAAPIDASAAPTDAAGDKDAEDPASDPDSAVTVPPCPAPNDSDYEEYETRCDGVDNDCDGIVDVLLPLEHNRCDAPMGSCGAGHYSCELGTRVCLAAGPADEVSDGVDNDCDGTVDEAVLTTPVRPRALLLIPSYLEREAGADNDNLAAILEQWGIPYDRPDEDELFESQLDRLADHSLAIVSSYLESDYLNEYRATQLREFVEAGGVLIVFKPILTPGDRGSELLGLMGTEGRLDLDRISFDGVPMAATRAFDTPEERSVPLQGVTAEETPVSWILHAAPDTEVGATGYIGDQPIGPLLTRRRLGYGTIYTLGHDLHSFWHTRCYVNCFEPSSDLTGLFLREALRESARGHIVLKHTVPGTEDSLVILSHDVDAPDAQNPGPIWGKAGAEQVAELEQRYSARGSYFITTDYINDYYSPALISRLCELDMCPWGVHSVRHSAELPKREAGDCMETRATYRDPETFCGEVRVPLEIIEADSGNRPIAWRSPFLYIHPSQYDILEAEGILFDSSYAVGDLKFNLPLSLARITINQLRFHRRALYSMPLSLEDGIGDIVEGRETRQEMSAGNARRFESLWTYTMLGNADNGAHTMVLLHPSYGLDVPEDNIKNKLVVEEAFLQACTARGVKLDTTVEDLALFWRARESTELDADYEDGVYRGTLDVGAFPLQGLTLEFGDAISRFDCDSCGALRIEGRRVLLSDPLAPGSRHTFAAATSLAD